MMILGYLMRFKLSRGEWIHVVGPCRGPSAGWGWQELPSHALMGALCLLLPLPIFPNNPCCARGKAARPVRYW